MAENCFPLAKLFPGRYPVSAGLSRFYADPEIDATTISITSTVNYREILKPFGHFRTYFKDIYLFFRSNIRFKSQFKISNVIRLILLMRIKIYRIIHRNIWK